MARSNGLADLQRRIRAMPRAARQEIAKALDLSIEEAAQTARRLVPRESGKLAETIRTEPGRHELARVVKAGGPATTEEIREGSGAKFDYAVGVEFGTTKTPPHPFFWPAWRLSRKRATNRVKRAVSKAAKRAGWSS